MTRSRTSLRKGVVTGPREGSVAGGQASRARPVPAEPSDGGLRMAIAVSRLYGALVRGFNGAARQSGASFEQWLVLSVVAQREAVTMGELARMLGINLSTLTRIVDRMVSASLLYRNIDPQDRRRVVLVASDAGQGMLRDLNGRLTGSLIGRGRPEEVVPSAAPELLRSLIDALEAEA